MSAVISIRVPKRVKEYLESFRDFDWKGYIVRAIEAKGRELALERLFTRLRAMNSRLPSSKVSSWELVREDRER
jgi:hypothetical protein